MQNRVPVEIVSEFLTTVRSGAAHAASLPGRQVYGQVGLVHTRSGWMSWFVGFRGNVAFAVLESGRTPRLSAAALASAFLSAIRMEHLAEDPGAA